MAHDPVVGGDILRLVTAGMYDNPLVLYREYLQNAADAIVSRGKGGGAVAINIDPLESAVTIMDDGTGLSPADAVRCLLPIGRSTKNPAVDRGLRGIGRLSSLAFADNVHFTTRTCASEPVTQISWNNRALRDLGVTRVDAETVIKACTTVRTVPGDAWPDRFFQVAVNRVTRHAASKLLNQDAVRNYIGEVCPVPMDSSFPLASEIQDFLATHTDYFVLDVQVNGDTSPVLRPFGPSIPLSDNYAADFERLEKRIIPRLDDDAPAAVLWLAHTPYAGSIPRRLGIRGLRARAGNIQIGSDNIFNHLFHETRFNGWCVGEVHIVDRRIVPNGRRDYFEPGPHLRNLENHIGAIAQEVSARCRGASSHRHRLRNVGAAIDQVKLAHDLAASGYLLADDATAFLSRARERVPHIEQTLKQLQIPASQFGIEDLAFCHGQTDVDAAAPDPTLALATVPPEALPTLQLAFGAIANAMPPTSALGMIEGILRRLSEAQVALRIDKPS